MVEKRAYQVWKGNNKFLFSGWLVFGPDIRSLLVTILLIIAPVAIFCGFVSRHLLHSFPNYNSGIAITVVTAVFTVYVLILLIVTAGRDPGIVPRSSHPPEPEEGDFSVSPADWVGGQAQRWRLPRTKDIVVNGVAVKVKYCDTCMLYRPPRCSHCSICNNCVERFDHHCPWVGQCIGQTTYENFRYRYENRVNPYNSGVLQNFQMIFCTQIEPSKNNFRAKVQLDANGQIIGIPATKNGGDLEVGSKTSWQTGEGDVTDEGQERIRGVSDVGLETKDSFDDALSLAIGRPLPVEVTDPRSGIHPRRSSWGRKSGSWEMTPEILALAVGQTESSGHNPITSDRPYESSQQTRS